jgi:hypothetical protein
MPLRTCYFICLATVVVHAFSPSSDFHHVARAKRATLNLKAPSASTSLVPDTYIVEFEAGASAGSLTKRAEDVSSLVLHPTLAERASSGMLLSSSTWRARTLRTRSRRTSTKPLRFSMVLASSFPVQLDWKLSRAPQTSK